MGAGRSAQSETQGPGRRRFLRLVAAAVLAAGSARAATAGPTRIRIANAGGTLNLTMGELMRQQRFLEAFDLAPELLTVADGTKILGGVVSGTVDASLMSGFGQVFPAIERGAPLKILGGGSLLPVLALFSAKAEIRTLKDLEGRTIGAGSVGALVHQLTVTLLQKHQVDTARIRFVNIGSSNDVFRAVSAGTVDAGAADAALIALAPRYHVHLIEQSNMATELREYTYQGAWTTDREIAGKRDVLVRALAAYATMYRFVQKPEAHDAFMRARRVVFPNVPVEDHEAQWQFLQTYKPFAVDLALTPERLRYMQDLNIRFKVQRTMLPFERVADMSLAADALKLVARRAAP